MSERKSLKSDQFVTKSNDLVEARYRLSLQESHVILWLLTQIQPGDEDFKLHVMKITDFADMVGLRVDTQYDELQKITLRLMQRVIQVYSSDKNETIQVSWLSLAKYQHKKGIVCLRFDPELKPYLLKLKKQFTKIDIASAMKFKSVYAVRVFELLSQYLSIGKREFSIEKLRDWCGIRSDEYKLYKNLKARVIDRAKKEINTKTEYEIDYREIKESRKVVSIEWTINKKTYFEKSQLEKAVIISKELRSINSIIEQLLEYGFTKQAANNITKNHDEINIANAIKAVDVYRMSHDVKNPKALISKAIKEQWRSDIYKTKKLKTP